MKEQRIRELEEKATSKLRDNIDWLGMHVHQIDEHLRDYQTDQNLEGYIKLWKEKMDKNEHDTDLTLSKIKFNHLIFTKLTKIAFKNMIQTYGTLMFLKRNELLYTEQAPITKHFYFVLYGSFSMEKTAKGGESFGHPCRQGFTIGEEIVFDLDRSKRYEACRAIKPSALVRIDYEKFRNMSNVTMGGNVKFQKDQE